MAKWLLGLLTLWLCAAMAAAAPRVITLAPHLTELAFAAGITPVAVSAWSDYPPEAKQLEQVANWQGIKLERILALKPDLVLAWRGGTPQRQIDQLRALGVTVLWLDPSAIDDIPAALRQLAPWSPHPQQAQADALPIWPPPIDWRRALRRCASVTQTSLVIGCSYSSASGRCLRPRAIRCKTSW